MKEKLGNHNSSANFFDSIIDDGTELTVQPEVEEVRSRTFCNRLQSIMHGPDPNGSQIALIRCAGSICLVFGLAEIGLGSSIFAEFVNAGVGAWWSTLLVAIAGIFGMISTTRFRVNMALTFAATGVIVALAGSIIDGIASTKIRSLITCGSIVIDSPTSVTITYYGQREGVQIISPCLKSSSSPAAGTCYCAKKSGDSCSVYNLSATSVSSGGNCGDILKLYGIGLIASTALCGTCVIAAAFLVYSSSMTIINPTSRFKFGFMDFKNSKRKESMIEISPESTFGLSLANDEEEKNDRKDEEAEDMTLW